VKTSESREVLPIKRKRTPSEAHSKCLSTQQAVDITEVGAFSFDRSNLPRLRSPLNLLTFHTQVPEHESFDRASCLSGIRCSKLKAAPQIRPRFPSR